MRSFEVGAIGVTSRCNLRCIMCPGHGPDAPEGHKGQDANPEYVKKFIRELPGEQVLTFAGGEPLLARDLYDYMALAVECGHKPTILTNGQLLTPETIDRLLAAGLHRLKISIDAIDPDDYRRIRVGGELQKILDALEYINTQKREEYPDLRIFVNTVILNEHPAEERMAAFEEFFEDKVDMIHFQIEHSGGLSLERQHFEVKDRVDCVVRAKLLGRGVMVPCCALSTFANTANNGKYDMSWLPNIKDTTPQEAYDLFVKLYRDPDSTFYKICRQCDRWAGFAQDGDNGSAWRRRVNLRRRRKQKEAAVEAAVQDTSPKPKEGKLSRLLGFMRKP